jgi:hypothetical protein
MAWEHDEERGHRRSLIQAFVEAIKDRISKPRASFDPLFPGVEAFRRLGTCPSRRATHKRQRRPVAAQQRIADRSSHRTGRDARSLGSGTARSSDRTSRSHTAVKPGRRRSHASWSCHVSLRAEPRTHSPFYRCDDLSLNEKPLLKTL